MSDDSNKVSRFQFLILGIILGLAVATVSHSLGPESKDEVVSITDGEAVAVASYSIANNSQVELYDEGDTGLMCLVNNHTRFQRGDVTYMECSETSEVFGGVLDK